VTRITTCQQPWKELHSVMQQVAAGLWWAGPVTKYLPLLMLVM